jgi:hypothetical protein
MLFRDLIYTEILAIFFGSIIEILIAASLQMRAPAGNPNRNWNYSIFSYYMLAIPLVVIPGIFFWMFTKNLKQIRGPKF